MSKPALIQTSCDYSMYEIKFKYRPGHWNDEGTLVLPSIVLTNVVPKNFGHDILPNLDPEARARFERRAMMYLSINEKDYVF